MNAPDQQAKAIFGDALVLADPAARAAYLDHACEANAALRQEVDSLLQAHEQAGNFLSSALPLPPELEAPGTRIGPYTVLEKLGEGGCGIVYLAEQAEPVQRKVALKIIKPGMDTREVIARFQAESQALALMDHPNIARALDGGATATGRPFFVMELVRGIPITDYSDQATLSVPERLELFLKVCAAVQHAHERGLIHRDLKPGNVLVACDGGDAAPKVIDFGVAKALEQPLTEKTVFTGYWQLLGTPAYMSPEQAALSGLEIDGRADVYALGVLLYELLTAETPFGKDAVRGAGPEEIRRLLREVEPPKPSLRFQMMDKWVGVVAMRRQADPSGLVRQVQGDLDCIVMKCLEKDRERRYESPAALAMDLLRHLQNQPIQARPPSVSYRAGKFIRRHRLPVAVASAVAVTLFIAAVVASALGLLRPLAIPGPQTAASQPAHVPAWQPGPWEVLFDGTSTAAFHEYGQQGFPHAQWSITTDGKLRAMGDSPSHIITKEQFDDFELTWEWAVDPNGNGGVIYRATEYYDEPYKSGPEYQLVDDEERDNPLDIQKSGALWGLIAPTNKVLKPLGQWNQSRLLVQSNHVEHWLNDRRVVQYELHSPEFNARVAASQFQAYPQFGKARKGGIVFQHWSSISLRTTSGVGLGVWYRNIKVRRLVWE